MTMRTITAMFDSRAEAERATEDLVREIKLARTAVRLDAGTGTGTATPQEQKGFLASLRDLFVPDEDRQTYAEGLRRGGAMVSAQVEETQIDRAMDVLERSGAVDLDEREAEWRRSGWTGGAAAAGAGAVVGASSDGTRTGVSAMPATGTSQPDGTAGNPSGTMLSRGIDKVAGTNVSGAHPENETAGGMARTAATGSVTGAAPLQGEEVIPIMEERLVVGKREVGRGRIRVRSYVVETPVQEQVTLHEEHVDVQRRVVDRPVTDADRLFQDRTIEATETSEEAIVAKDVRVKEELVVRKDATDRVQTVQDTVRRTEVEVDDQRTAGTAARTGTAPKVAPVQPAPKTRDRT